MFFLGKRLYQTPKWAKRNDSESPKSLYRDELDTSVSRVYVYRYQRTVGVTLNRPLGRAAVDDTPARPVIAGYHGLQHRETD